MNRPSPSDLAPISNEEELRPCLYVWELGCTLCGRDHWSFLLRYLETDERGKWWRAMDCRDAHSQRADAVNFTAAVKSGRLFRLRPEGAPTRDGAIEEAKNKRTAKIVRLSEEVDKIIRESATKPYTRSGATRRPRKNRTA